MAKVGELARELPVEPVEVLPRPGHAQLRQDVVRDRHRRAQRILERLVAERSHRHRPVCGVVGEDCVARQVGLRGERDLGRQVAEIAVVGNFLRVDGRAPSRAELLRVPDAEEVAVAIGDAVVGKEFGVELPGELGLEVAPLEAQLQAALGEYLRRERGVAILGDVPVERQRGLEAALARSSEGGREESGLAAVVERKRDERRVEDRHPEEVHGRVVRGADVARAVDHQLVHANEPVVARHRARRVFRVEQAVLLVFLEQRALGVPARGGAPLRGLRELEHRSVELAGVVLEVIDEARAARDVAFALQAHVARGHRALLVAGIVEAVGVDHRAALAQHDAARGDHVVRFISLDAVGLEELGAVALEARRRQVQLLVELEADFRRDLRVDARGNHRATERNGERPDASRPQGSGGSGC